MSENPTKQNFNSARVVKITVLIVAILIAVVFLAFLGFVLEDILNPP